MNNYESQPIFVVCSTCEHPSRHIEITTQEENVIYLVYCERCGRSWNQNLRIPNRIDNEIDIEN